MNETHATKYLLGLSHTKKGGSAERERCLLEALGNPQKNLFIIKILGEAGKSSASSLLASLLSHGKVPTGSITLTPIKEPRLAVQMGKNAPSHDAFAKAVTAVWNAARAASIDEVSYEEILLAAALLLFAENGCRVALIALAVSATSAASALSAPPLCLVTSTDEETAGRLVPLIDTSGELISAPQELSVYRLLTARAAATHCRLSFPIKHDVGEAQIQNGSLLFTYRGKQYSISSTAHYQKDNAIVAIEAYHALLRKGFRLTEKNLTDAFAGMSSALCFRFFSVSPAWLVDAADSPMRLSALANSLAKQSSLFGNGFAILTEPHLATACQNTFGEQMLSLECLEIKALRRTLKQKKTQDGAPLVIVGSKPFAEEALRALHSLFL